MAAGILLADGLELEHIAGALAGCSAPPGRMERIVAPAGPRVVVDFAHTPDALRRVLEALRPHAAARIWCVFGCGGERDAGKRPLMGAVARQFADRVSSPTTTRGAKTLMPSWLRCWKARGSGDGVEVIRDRAEAIRHAIHSRRARISCSSPARATSRCRSSAPSTGHSRTRWSRTARWRSSHDHGTTFHGGSSGRRNSRRPGRRLRIRQYGYPHISSPANSFSPCAETRRAAHSSWMPARSAQPAPWSRSAQNAALPQVQVADTRLAFGDLARSWRSQFCDPIDRHHRLERQDHRQGDDRRGHAARASTAVPTRPPRSELMTWGNLNNEIGLPRTLLYLNAGPTKRP